MKFHLMAIHLNIPTVPFQHYPFIFFQELDISCKST
jgi:hypothetical protein